MKKFIAPAIEIEKLHKNDIIATSLIISDDTVDTAQTRENEFWF